MLPRRRRLLIGLIGGVLLLLIGGRVVTQIWVELEWYRALGLTEVFWTRLRVALMFRLIVGAVVGGFVFANLWVVSKTLGSLRVRRRYGNIEIAERLPQSYMVAAVAGVSLLSAWWLSAAAGDPLTAAAALRHVPWGEVDPVFGRDLSFYVFTLPLLRGVQGILGVLLFWTALLSIITYVATGSIRVQDGRPQFTPATARHLGLLLAGFLVVFAWDAWLDRYGLLLAGTGVGGAFGYTDAHARLPALAVTAVVGLLTAAAVAYGAWYGRRREPIAAAVLLVLVLVVGRAIWPTAVQRLSVEPNQLPRERAYIERHIDATLTAYGLSGLQPRPFAYRVDQEGLSAGRLMEHLEGVPLWDPRPLRDVFGRRQALFDYYGFQSVHLARYQRDGGPEQVAISVRELVPGELPATAQTWQNLHLRYVSGQGAVVSPVAQMTEDGAPVLYLSDLNPPRLSPQAPPELALEEPRVFFGETMDRYVIVDSEGGPRGASLRGPLRRLAFAWAFQDKNLLLSSEIRPTSRIVYGRTVLARARAAAPFLSFTSDSPYPVVTGGRVLWFVDAYTTTPSYPLSPLSRFGDHTARYVRHSAKVLVDGATGEVAVYAVDPDPILATYSRIFPGLVRPLEQMPPDLQAHLRFPPSLMGLQAQILGEYHLTDPRAFYEKEDVWATATENYRSEPLPMRPTFVVLPVPEEDRSEFLLMLPFVSRTRQNMTALFVTRNDPPHFGEQVLYLLPRDELIPGPQQVESMIDQEPDISQQLSLWRRGGSEVLRGHMVVVPVDGRLVYVEPLYLEAQNAAIPQLERVIAAHAGRVVMRPTLGEAVAALVGAADEERAEDEPAEPGQAAPGPRAAAMERARRLMEEAEAQLRAGDWAGFGRTWEALREALGRAGASAGGAG